MKVHGQYNTARVCRLFHQFASLGAQSVLDDASSAERVDLVPYRKPRRDVLARLGDDLAQSGVAGRWRRCAGTANLFDLMPQLRELPDRYRTRPAVPVSDAQPFGAA